MLTFDEPTHTYRFGDRIVPSVTQVLDRAHSFGFVTAEVLAAAQDRGTFVHKLCELHDLDDLHPSEYDGTDHAGYLQAWVKFLADKRPNWAGIERRCYSQRFSFAGTMDRCGTLEQFGRDRWIIDIKTSAQKYRVWGMQTAAYRQLMAEEDPNWMLARRATVRLKKDGTYLFDEWTDKRDLPAFLALITFLDWDTNHG